MKGKLRRKGKLPCHYATVYVPGQGWKEVGHTFPIGKAKGRHYCKYCYQTHTDWWEMNPKDYGDDNVLLCAKCEHTSKMLDTEGC